MTYCAPQSRICEILDGKRIFFVYFVLFVDDFLGGFIVFLSKQRGV